jgi:hypothetical protein
MKIVAAENIAVGKDGSYKILIKYRRENIDHIYIDNPLKNKEQRLSKKKSFNTIVYMKI